MKEYKVPTGDSEIEFIEKRSRFICRVWKTETEEQALECIRKMREQHWDATHNVYAYIIKDGPTRFSDDGEPGGTAGMPVLEVFRREEIHNVCCVVTRYFGGILLGAGGLVRAYAASAKQALDAAGVSVVKRLVRGQVQCGYALYEKIRNLTLEHSGLVEDTEFGAQVVLTLLLPENESQTFEKKLTELSAGKLEFKITGESFTPVPLK